MRAPRYLAELQAVVLRRAQRESFFAANDLALLGQDVISQLINRVAREELLGRAVPLHALAMYQMHFLAARDAKLILAVLADHVVSTRISESLLDFGEAGDRFLRKSIKVRVRMRAFLDTNTVTAWRCYGTRYVTFDAAAGGGSFASCYRLYLL